MTPTGAWPSTRKQGPEWPRLGRRGPRDRRPGPWTGNRRRHETKRYSTEQRTAAFWSRVDKNGPIPEFRPDLGPCWLWLGGKRRGYGRFYDGTTGVEAHRWAYMSQWLIPDGLQLDHLCRVRACVRATHLEPVTNQVNVLRGFEVHSRPLKPNCQQGHRLPAMPDAAGRRRCKVCERVYRERWRRNGTTQRVA